MRQIFVTLRYLGTAISMQLLSGYSITVLAMWAVPAMADASSSWRFAIGSLSIGPCVGLCALGLQRCVTARRVRIARGEDCELGPCDSKDRR